MHSFSIHLVAEVNKVNKDGIHEHYDDLEKEMLVEFYEFVKSHHDFLWLHWNMSNINYGFETLAHRYKVLTGSVAPQLSDSKRFNLSTLIQAIYGWDCVEKPLMVNLMNLNDGRPRDLLTGLEEVEAFKNKEYVKLHKSTMCKVYWFKSMYYKLQNRKIKTAHTNIWNRVNEFMENPWVKLLGFVAVLFTVFQFIQTVMSTVNSQNPTNIKQFIPPPQIDVPSAKTTPHP
ncbi:MAG: hypothetical protein GW908_11465 [Thiomicrospira sp.]|nr:hypothetical protein [Thiomicrospira sp.]